MALAASNSLKAFGNSEYFQDLLSKANSSHFTLVLGGTETVQVPGISAAGANSEMLKYTAALDAEYIYYGECKTLKSLPVSPAKIYSPAVISKACLNLTKMPFTIVDAGAAVKPLAPHLDLRAKPAKNIQTGLAMSRDEVERLFIEGSKFASELIQEKPEYLTIAECVVAGTTTANAVLHLLGYDCFSMLSSSFPESNHSLKQELINQAVENIDLPALLRSSEIESKSKLQVLRELTAEDPLLTISLVGDSMQAFVLGFAVECIKQQTPVLLAGGSQMITIAALVKRLLPNIEDLHRCMAVATTKWVAEDYSAKIQDLLEMSCGDLALFYWDFANVNQTDLFKAYDQGHVKEGVGAGAMSLLAMLSYNISEDSFSEEINRLCLKLECF